MDSSELGERQFSPSGIAMDLARLRQEVLAQWKARVLAQEGRNEPLLVRAAPALLDAIETALLPGAQGMGTVAPRRASDFARYLDPGEHGFKALLRELQLLRSVLYAALGTAQAAWHPSDVDAIGAAFDTWMLAAAGCARNGNVAMKMNEACISGFAHDLRNPLNVASATAQLIGLKSADPAIGAMAARIVSKVADADALIQTLQDAAVLEYGHAMKLHLSNFNIMSLVEEVCVDLPMIGQPVSIKGERIDGHWCRAALKRALEGLVARARKHGKRAAPITVRVTRDGDRLCLSVHNDGVAIPAQDLARLFEPPQRAEELAIKGWSLGLPYVRRVAESHGGAMLVDSADERGTTFTVQVPIDARRYVAA
jgi:signal transduction histidine kinase